MYDTRDPFLDEYHDQLRNNKLLANEGGFVDEVRSDLYGDVHENLKNSVVRSLDQRKKDIVAVRSIDILSLLMDARYGFIPADREGSTGMEKDGVGQMFFTPIYSHRAYNNKNLKRLKGDVEAFQTVVDTNHLLYKSAAFRAGFFYNVHNNFKNPEDWSREMVKIHKKVFNERVHNFG